MDDKKLRKVGICQSTISESGSGSTSQIQQTVFAEFKNDVLAHIGQSLSAQLYPFALSWSHYLILMRIADEQERRFYEIEAVNQQWMTLPDKALLQRKLAEWAEAFEEEHGGGAA